MVWASNLQARRSYEPGAMNRKKFRIKALSGSFCHFKSWKNAGSPETLQKIEMLPNCRKPPGRKRGSNPIVNDKILHSMKVAESFFTLFSAGFYNSEPIPKLKIWFLNLLFGTVNRISDHEKSPESLTGLESNGFRDRLSLNRHVDQLASFLQTLFDSIALNQGFREFLVQDQIMDWKRIIFRKMPHMRINLYK